MGSRPDHQWDALLALAALPLIAVLLMLPGEVWAVLPK